MKFRDTTIDTPDNDGLASAILSQKPVTVVSTNLTTETGTTSIPTQGKYMPAFYARPAEAGEPSPIVLVIHEIFGVNEHIRDICRRLANEGYLAIAPDLFFREGNPADYSDITTLMGQLVSKVPDAQVLADLDHVANWASRNSGDMCHSAITGFCWGGRICWLYAAHSPQLKAAVAWYGKLTAKKTLQQPHHPLDIASQISVPVLGLYGGQDDSIPQESVAMMRDALSNANTDAEIRVYPDAGHAFNADYRASYHSASANDGWQRMLAWFKKAGVTSALS